MKIIETWITSDDAARLHHEKCLPVENEYSENQFVVFKVADGQGHILTRYRHGVCRVVEEHAAYGGVRGRNLEQRLAMDLLFDPTIEFAALTGVAGCGKTFLAWAAGLELVQRDYYDYLIIGRPAQEGDDTLGILPGDIEDKYTPYLAPFWDQMIALTDRSCGRATMDALMREGKVELLPLSLIKGRNLDNAFVILDEAEDMTIGQIQQAVTRINNPKGRTPRTKLVLTGDLSQIDRRACKRGVPPLQYAIDYFTGHDLFGHVELKDSQRGRLAQLGAEMDRDYED